MHGISMAYHLAEAITAAAAAQGFRQVRSVTVAYGEDYRTELDTFQELLPQILTGTPAAGALLRFEASPDPGITLLAVTGVD